MLRRLLRKLVATRRRRWMLLLALAGFLIFQVAAVELTSQSWFCNSCHIMNSYHASWHASTHKDVQCVKCHIEPGARNFMMAKLNGLGQVVDDVLDRTGKPSASVANFSCTRSGCHDLEKVRATTRPDGLNYKFAHRTHMDLAYSGIGVHCTTCHSHVKGDKHFEISTDTCISCHMKTVAPPDAAATQGARVDSPQPTDGRTAAAGGTMRAFSFSLAPTTSPAGSGVPSRQCRTCHEPPKDDLWRGGLKVVHSDFIGYGAQCESCHRGVTAQPARIADEQCYACHDFGLERVTSVTEVHRQHTTKKHKIECFECHGLTRHGLDVQTAGVDRFDCESCHQGQHNIQRETYRFVVAKAATQPEGLPITPMFLAHVDCNGCHTQNKPLSSKPAPGQTVAAASAAACDVCHKPGLGQQMIPLWQKNLRQMHESTEKMFKELSDPARPFPSPADRQLLNEAARLLDAVRLDGSWGVHNPRYSEQMILEAKAKLIELERRRPATAPATRPDGERGGP